MLVQVFQILKELTVQLQSIAIDVVQAYAMVESIASILKDMRRELESEFHKQFIEAAALGKKLHGDDFELSKPRIAGRQAHRDNVPSSNVADYYMQDNTVWWVPLSRCSRDGDQIYQQSSSQASNRSLVSSPHQVYEPFP